MVGVMVPRTEEGGFGVILEEIVVDTALTHVDSRQELA